MKNSKVINNDKSITPLIPAFDHRKPADDDCGLPENAIFSDYPQTLRRGNLRTGGIQRPKVDLKATIKSGIFLLL